MTNGEKVLDKLIEEYGKEPCIAFLPYKFSMWDSMQTVYEAAIRRGIRAYIAPIPYMTVGSKKMHDESYMWGNSLCLEDLQGVDIVVIHYPYDDRNYVTRLSEEYYSGNLKKKYKICYLAYCGEVASEKFIIQPGIKNADYIFTNTVKEKNLYISYWSKKGVDKSKNVFCVGGLPKYDFIYSVADAPFEWRYKPDAFTVLVSGALGKMMNNPYEWMKKKEVLIKKLYDKGNQVIFRPHPLTRDTIESMFSPLLDRYDEFLRDVGMYCILDLTEDLHRAIQLSDYLISDPSSVVSVWKQTGKGFEVL